MKEDNFPDLTQLFRNRKKPILKEAVTVNLRQLLLLNTMSSQAQANFRNFANSDDIELKGCCILSLVNTSLH